MKQRKKHEEIESQQVSSETGNGMNETDNSGTANDTSVESKELSEKEVEAIKESKALEELAKMQEKYEEVNDKYLRLYSEFDNFRKRALKERIEMSKNAAEQVLTEFLGILDDFERAIASFEKVESVEPLKEGTVLIYNKFKNSLTGKGLTEIDAHGQTFDTDYHEAIAKIPAPSEDQKNKVLDVTQKGYMLNGKVIRFAKVVVGN